MDAHHSCYTGLKTTQEVSPGQHVSGGPLINAPQLHQYPLQRGDELLILASDGLWDKVDSKAAGPGGHNISLLCTSPGEFNSLKIFDWFKLAQPARYTQRFLPADKRNCQKLLGKVSDYNIFLIKPACGDVYRVVLQSCLEAKVICPGAGSSQHALAEYNQPTGLTLVIVNC